MAAALTVLLVAACGSDVSSGGGGSGPSPDCGDDIPCLDRHAQAADAIEAGAIAMRAEVASACAAIAADLGASGVPDVSNPATVSDSDVELACELASAQLALAAQAQTATYQLSIGGDYCAVDADAQLACEAALPPGGCDPGTMLDRCPPASLVGNCQGGCSGDCTGTAAQCAGFCQGRCEGQCSGNCLTATPNGSCNGVCDGVCSGLCHGTCSIEASASVQCNGLCEGACDSQLSEPLCTDELGAVGCDVDPLCASACAALGAAGASCPPPFIGIGASAGSADPAFIATVEANLPALRAATRRAAFLLAAIEAPANLLTAVDPATLGSGCDQLLIDLSQQVAASVATIEASLSAALEVLAALGA